MKKLRKIFAFMLAFAMTLALSITAFAAGDDGTITINNATEGKEYAIYKVFDATASGTNVAYTYTKTPETDAFYNKLITGNSPFVLTETSNLGTYNVSTTANAQTISDWLTANKELLTQIGTQTADAEQTIQFRNLAYGYYYITSSLGTVVTIDTATPNAIVQDKNQKPGPGDEEDDYKYIVDADGNKIDESTVNYGDTVRYVLTAAATNYDGDKQITKYIAHDVLGSGLDDLLITKVEVYKTDGIVQATVGDWALSKEGNRIDIIIPWATEGTGDDAGTYTSLYDPNSIIKVYCEATVNNTATIGKEDESNLTNQGWFSWYTGDTKIDETPTEERSTVTSYTYAIGIYKTDIKGDALPGAKFTIKDKNDIEIKVKKTEEPGVYEYDPTSDITEVVSPENGIIIVKGLAADGTYKLHETEAPDGYNALNSDVLVDAEQIKASTKTLTIYKDAEGNITDQKDNTQEVEVPFDVNVAAKNIVNQTGAELPSTGGMGTTIFYVIGGILVVGAGILLVVKRRMRGQL